MRTKKTAELRNKSRFGLSPMDANAEPFVVPAGARRNCCVSQGRNRGNRAFTEGSYNALISWMPEPAELFVFLVSAGRVPCSNRAPIANGIAT